MLLVRRGLALARRLSTTLATASVSAAITATTEVALPSTTLMLVASVLELLLLLILHRVLTTEVAHSHVVFIILLVAQVFTMTIPVKEFILFLLEALVLKLLL